MYVNQMTCTVGVCFFPLHRHIVYCVPNIDELLAGNDSEIMRHVTLVEGLSDQWYLMYECVTTVAQMNFQVSLLSWLQYLN